MRSTFHSLEVARRGLVAQQTALQTVGHNIANANTPGFTRQRVNFVQTEPYPPASLNRPQIPGQMGTGVEVGNIQRVRESFLDIQYRGENNKLGYWETRAESLQKMEEIMNEPSETGLSTTLDRFWQAFQDLAVNPTNAGARSVVRQRGLAVAETFRYLSDSLSSVQADMKNELDVTVKQVNALSQQINNINKQIGELEPHGYLANDLYDERDRLVDELSKLVNIKTTIVSSSGNPSSIAEGKLTIDMVDETGRKIGTLVDANSLRVNNLSLEYRAETGLVDGFKLADTSFGIESMQASGKLRGLIDSFGFMQGNVEKGIYPDMLNHLDTLAFEFAQEINRVHQSGWSVSSMESGEHTAFKFFEFTNTDISAGNIKNAAKLFTVSADIIQSLDNIAASGYNQGVIATGEFYGYSGVENISITVQSTVDANGTQQFTYKIYDASKSPKQELKTSGEFASLEELAATLSEEFVDEDGNPSVSFNMDFVRNEDLTKGNFITVNIPNTGEVAGRVGDGSNAIALAEVKARTLQLNGVSTTFQNYYESVIGGLAVDAQEANRLAYNSETLRLSVDQRRQSVSGVSLDEEMTNMIQFQHAYNASARMITLTDELLDRIINGMGIGGR
ncbi:flagellar hook-associated protein FlgK [Sutcliffiella rhizosphaerae]|uniref:Flagellar hook-associated protein 1 n=1 Tax=Sutcliffiella rhizosphaerae TaxID=2880967 RepID=A0ABM8YNF6_9BACI|nr:flagellar hook-associated protein FlgK [Sutcliffiella rhizosphaerae]CAG9621433.1 Flagellar hook-associated protein 1 [Sutcliffiella rhizosphaerae]